MALASDRAVQLLHRGAVATVQLLPPGGEPDASAHCGGANVSEHRALAALARKLLSAWAEGMSHKARFTMPMHDDRRTRRRVKREYRALDWFSEDPWAETGSEASNLEESDWSLDSWDSEDQELDLFVEDPYDGWGPVRPRGRRRSHAP